MESEASAIARKIQNFIVVENAAADPAEQKHGMFRNILLIGLMGLAVTFTQITLVLVRWVKHLEG